MGTTCDAYLKNHTVFVPPQITIDILEERLKAAYGVIKESKDMNPNCRGYALPSLCYSILPICRTPEKTNHQYFANKAALEHMKSKTNRQFKLMNNSGATTGTQVPTTITTTTTTTTTTHETPTYFFHGGVTPAIDIGTFNGNVVTTKMDMDRLRRRRRRRRSFDVTVDAKTKFVSKKQHYLRSDGGTSDINGGGGGSSIEKSAYRQTPYPPTRSTENLRRICRNECELLENELCQKEYAIAKRHPTIGQKLPLEDCYNLPDNDDCSKLGIVLDVDENEKCYWEMGTGYRGTVAVSASGKPCLQWARLMKEIANYPELAGQNYCRYVCF